MLITKMISALSIKYVSNKAEIMTTPDNTDLFCLGPIQNSGGVCGWFRIAKGSEECLAHNDIRGIVQPCVHQAELRRDEATTFDTAYFTCQSQPQNCTLTTEGPDGPSPGGTGADCT
jgi:hypothetical protein